MLRSTTEPCSAPSAVPLAAPNSQPQPPTPRRASTPRLSVVVVNYRQWEETAALVEQLIASPSVRDGRAEVVVVDNHSPHHRLVHKLRRCSGVSLRRWGKNHGFARAVNEGCRLSQGDWLLLLNPDVTLTEGFLEGILQRAEVSFNEGRIGIVGFHLRNSDGSIQLSTGEFPTLSRTLARMAVPRARRKYQTIRSSEPCEVPWVTGCCLLARRECFEDLGGLDEDFFLYYEDVDLCRRARAKGWSVWYDPGLALIHHHPLHSRQVPAYLRLVVRHSLLLYAKKHWSPLKQLAIGLVMRGEAKARRFWSWWRGDQFQAQIFAQLDHLLCEVMAGRGDEARRRIEQLVQRIDLRVGL